MAHLSLRAPAPPDRPREGGTWESEADDTKIYRLPTQTPVPIDRRDYSWVSDSGEHRAISLAEAPKS